MFFYLKENLGNSDPFCCQMELIPLDGIVSDFLLRVRSEIRIVGLQHRLVLRQLLLLLLAVGDSVILWQKNWKKLLWIVNLQKYFIKIVSIGTKNNGITKYFLAVHKNVYFTERFQIFPQFPNVKKVNLISPSFLDGYILHHKMLTLQKCSYFRSC